MKKNEEWVSLSRNLFFLVEFGSWSTQTRPATLVLTTVRIKISTVSRGIQRKQHMETVQPICLNFFFCAVFCAISPKKLSVASM